MNCEITAVGGDEAKCLYRLGQGKRQMRERAANETHIDTRTGKKRFAKYLNAVQIQIQTQRATEYKIESIYIQYCGPTETIPLILFLLQIKLIFSII